MQKNLVKESDRMAFPLIVGSLCLYGFTLPLSKSISTIVMGAIYAVCLGMVAVQKEFRMNVYHSVQQPLNLSIGLYIGVLCLGLSYSQDLREGISVLKQAVNLFLVYLMFAVLLDAEHDRERRIFIAQTALFAFLMGIFVLDVIAFLTYSGVIGNRQFILPVTPLKMHHIWFGNLNALGLLVAAALLVPQFPKGNMVQTAALWIFLPVAVAALLLSTSRTAWLGTICAVTVFFYIVAKKKRLFFLLSGFFLGGCVAAYFISDIVHTRINQIYWFLTGNPDISLGARFVMWKASLSMFFSNPLLGVGTGDYKSMIAAFVASGQYPDILGKFNQPHNMYLFALATNGIVGLSAFLFIFYRIMRYTKTVLRQQGKAFGGIALIVTIHFLVAGLTESLFNIHVLISSFAMLMGISVRTMCLRDIDE